MDQDREHLRLLAVFHYVVAGIAALFALFPVIHLAIGILMIAGRLPDGSEGALERGMGWFFVTLASAMILAGLVFASGLALAGRFLSQRRHYRYCLVMAGIACAFMPFGTVLGVFTILVLMRDPVRSMFGVGPAAGTPKTAAVGRPVPGGSP